MPVGQGRLHLGVVARRDRRIHRQQEDILRAAASVFSEKGMPLPPSMTLLLKADIGDGTIYNYFPASGKSS